MQVGPRISVVIVAYRSADVLEPCIRSVPSDVEVIVVDQMSPDATASVVARTERTVRLIAAGANRGFGAGCNIGAANAMGNTIIFLNPDAQLTSGAAHALAEAVARWGGGIVGPRIVDGHGNDVTRAARRSSSWSDIVDLLVPVVVQPKRWRRYVERDCEIYRSGGQVWSVQGSCMAIDSGVFWECGGFDERLFLYGEEEYLSVQLRRAGYCTAVEPKAVVSHLGKTSTNKVGLFAVEQYYRSRVILYRHLGSKRSAVGRTMMLGVAIQALWLTTPVRSVIGYRRSKDAAWCRAALRGLRRGLVGRPVMSPSGPWSPTEA